MSTFNVFCTLHEAPLSKTKPSPVQQKNASEEEETRKQFFPFEPAEVLLKAADG